MTCVSCSVSERFVNPLFEVFDGGDFILSSYRDIERPLTEMRIFVPDGQDVSAARSCLQSALEIVGVEARLEESEIADEDWRFAYRRHFKTELVSPRIYTVPEWELEDFVAAGKPEPGKIAIVSDPGMAFGTGKHETTKACLQYIDEIASGAFPLAQSVPETFLDMGCGSGILSIAAKKLGFKSVSAFDVDQEAVDATLENAAKNSVELEVFRYGLGSNVKRPLPPGDLVVANILGPLLIRFAEEISAAAPKLLVISGILTELYPEVLAAFVARGYAEVSRKTIGEWTTGLLERKVNP